MGAGKAIEILGLEKKFREDFWKAPKAVLKDVSFDVPAGQIFGFLGANGAGKTTTIKIALGLQFANKGAIRIFGIDSRLTEARLRIGFLPERPYFHLNLTGNEFLDFHRRLYRAHSHERPLPGNGELLREVGLADVGNRLLRNYSKGMLQRIGLAQALINDPDLVILDEPMSGLDPVGRRDVRNIMLELHKRGKTIFFSTHILSDIESICQQIAFLEKGELKYCGSINDLLKSGAREYEILFEMEDGRSIPEFGENAKLKSWGKLVRLSIRGDREARAAVEALWAIGAKVNSFGLAHKSLEDILFGDKRGEDDIGSLRNGS